LATAILALACLLGILCIALFIWLIVGLVKRLEVEEATRPTSPS